MSSEHNSYTKIWPAINRLCASYGARTIERKKWNNTEIKSVLFQPVAHTWNKHKNKNAKTAAKRFSCFRHAVLHMDSACCWNVSVFYFSFISFVRVPLVESPVTAWKRVATYNKKYSKVQNGWECSKRLEDKNLICTFFILSMFTVLFLANFKH